MEIDKLIVKHRTEQNLSQRELARKVGIRQATLCAVESGGDVKFATAQSILRALGLDFDAVPVRKAEGVPIAERADALQLVREHVLKRRRELKGLIGELSRQQIRHVREINLKTNTGYLAELWNDFLQLDLTAMQQALDVDRFKGMAWQSLLQANPFIVASVGSWA
jgi:transcriptional regulator with XRE-family HTH domain